jgi:uncharacterized protein YfaQ (DUF2300 family)
MFTHTTTMPDSAAMLGAVNTSLGSMAMLTVSSAVVSTAQYEDD